MMTVSSIGEFWRRMVKKTQRIC